MNLFLLFVVSLLLIFFIYKLIGSFFSIDLPNDRKRHKVKVPQIGGIIFGPLFLFVGWVFSFLPNWYIICGLVTIVLGAIDDNLYITWKIKLVVQLFLAAFLGIHFWGVFDSIIFYNFTTNVIFQK